MVSNSQFSNQWKKKGVSFPIIDRATVRFINNSLFTFTITNFFKTDLPFITCSSDECHSSATVNIINLDFELK